MRTLTVAYSPCPNDTFMFHALAAGQVPVLDTQLRVALHDIDTLNRFVLEAAFDISKVSFHAFLKARDRYELLRTGAALGFGCGPLVVAAEPISKEDLQKGPVAVPGLLTTANLLMKLWAPEIDNVTVLRYDEIVDNVRRGSVRAGLIIHESRFVYREAGLHCLCDLGEWWEKETHLPIPLGGVVARRSIGSERIAEFNSALRQSIQQAQKDPGGAWDYVRGYAQETDENVIRQHIAMFVNDRSLDLGPEGRAAVDKMEAMALERGILK